MAWQSKLTKDDFTIIRLGSAISVYDPVTKKEIPVRSHELENAAAGGDTVTPLQLIDYLIGSGRLTHPFDEFV
ncbi:hypothetical protein [Arsenicibacter rosenii]|uniref:Uncharacterized protein n=1 Tax=Arsenicibacter rosenii TaxID=1750698 RepID=A0A1S2VM02_9BACT|nr:hypothetical protein [Arsenicibacter rosenii]OIN59784.1 hypothetical protein BLX24_07970 [Arsenicibacter rosenii]